MSTTSPDPAAPMLVVGATGYLGSQVVDELLASGENVRALVRPSTDVTKVEAQVCKSPAATCSTTREE